MALTTFTVVPYTSDKGLTYKCRLSSKSIAVAGNAVTADIDDDHVDVSVSHHGQKRRAGINARGIVIGLPAVAPATGFARRTFVPIVDKTVFDAFTYLDNVQYDGATWQVLDKINEV